MANTKQMMVRSVDALTLEMVTIDLIIFFRGYVILSFTNSLTNFSNKNDILWNRIGRPIWARTMCLVAVI